MQVIVWGNALQIFSRAKNLKFYHGARGTFNLSKPNFLDAPAEIRKIIVA